MYPNVLNEIGSNQWAMPATSFDGILKAVDGQLTPKDYELFHRLDENARATTLSLLGPQVEETFYSRIAGNLGSLFISGPIVPRATWFSQVSGLVSLDALTDEFLALEENPEVEKILLVMDSPGGAVKGLTDFVQVLKAGKKPLEAINIGMMASAAYWIGSAAKKIYSVDTGIVGSIGVILTVDNPNNENRTVIRSAISPNKNAEPDTEKGRAELQRIVDDLGSIFVTAVAENRDIKEKTVLNTYGGGSVFVAKDALIRGMIDGIMSLRDYIDGGAANVALRTPAGSNVDYSATAPGSEGAALVEENNINLEVKKMGTLKELRAENPAIDAEVKAVAEAAKAEALTGYRATAQKVAKILQSDEYGKSIKGLGFRVLTGESSFDALESAVAAVDETRAKNEIAAAVADSGEVAETPAESPNAGQVSEDGSINSEADFEASLVAQRAQLI